MYGACEGASTTCANKAYLGLPYVILMFVKPYRTPADHHSLLVTQIATECCSGVRCCASKAYLGLAYVILMSVKPVSRTSCTAAWPKPCERATKGCSSAITSAGTMGAFTAVAANSPCVEENHVKYIEEGRRQYCCCQCHRSCV